ncbi:MAG: Holliday junction branch migration DNA helicase RuvB [Armatimonadota bacterium]|nr:Holliday junction branch migration DNA helicase RuvB [Armatimonadota bacterium]MDR7402380.1 Holliday junction branch migration DNA helicase RuvB [Armatimonadota bacterium]MDR7404066.1 Holliday junction branch migration DNA helicase RuvB [Armatimonadota bacterium]MDR7437598.1 Holliday junction branch migration DNA helicase RuvB [Armatimonadota bacterium]MDR7472192.1 Holliday junction branch migration DNA helicase RuvB [Armatimonadota bacterium]
MPSPKRPAPDPAVDEPFLRSLRPQSLDECIGQPRVVEGLRISIRAARERGEALDHVLLHGPPGLGKTTLANVIAREMDANIVTTSGPALERGGDLMGILTNLQPRDVLFIDEIHRLSRAVEEFLYPAMEDFCVNFVIEKGAHARTLRYQLPPFTLVGATTRAGLLSSPLRERFGIFHHLDFFTVDELVAVVRRSASILGVPITDDGAATIAQRSRGTPRIANRLLRRVRDYAQVRADGRITAALAAEALDFEGVDERGLDGLDRELLRTIAVVYGGGPVGIEALAATLNEEPQTLEEVVEPYLLKIGFLTRTPAGRRITAAALEHLGLPADAGRQGHLL